tara:strand:+ start:923 stop:1321 length:399 start_codon:yes stop_codon:yes gene_type:complete
MSSAAMPVGVMTSRVMTTATIAWAFDFAMAIWIQLGFAVKSRCHGSAPLGQHGDSHGLRRRYDACDTHRNIMRIHHFLPALLVALPLAGQERAAVGQRVPDVTFPQFLNGDGRQKLSEFFGQPVIIDRWGTR